jgi:hypothetical protein
MVTVTSFVSGVTASICGGRSFWGGCDRGARDDALAEPSSVQGVRAVWPGPASIR